MHMCARVSVGKYFRRHDFVLTLLRLIPFLCSTKSLLHQQSKRMELLKKARRKNTEVKLRETGNNLT